MGTVHGIKAGRAFVLIEAVDRTGKVLEGIRHRIGRFASEMTQMGQSMALRAAAALTPVAFSLNTYKQFDDAMRKVEARSTGTGQQLQYLRDQAKELGRTTAFTATHIANLQARLAQFGMSREDIAAAVKPIMLLARAGGEGLDLGTDILQATDAVTQTLSAFQLPTTETAGIADMLTVALNASKFNLEELSTALQHAAPTAANFNMSIKETIAILSAMRELGYDASIVGTAFRNMWLRMSRQKGRDDFNKTLQELTGRTIEFTDAAGNLRNPIQILQELRGAMAGIGTAQAADMIAKLFELRATGPSLGLMKATDTLARMLAVLGDVGGEAQRVHDKMESGIGGAFRNFESAVEGVQIAIGEALDKMVTNLSNFSQQYLLDISRWVAANAGYIAIVVAAIAAVGAFGVALIVLGQIVMATTAILGVMSAITGAVIAGISAIVSLSPAGLVAIAAGLVGIAAAWLILSQIDFGKVTGGAEHSLDAMAYAIQSGRIKDAWDILIASMTLAFMQFALEVQKELNNIAHWLVMIGRITPGINMAIGAAETALGSKLTDFADMQLAIVRAGVVAAELKLDQAEFASSKHQGEADAAKYEADLEARRAAGEANIRRMTMQAWLDHFSKNVAPIAVAPRAGNVPPDILEGFRIGSVEAAKAMQEAAYNTSEQADDAKRTADAAEETVDELQAMNGKLDQLAVGAV